MTLAQEKRVGASPATSQETAGVEESRGEGGVQDNLGGGAGY